MKQLIEKINEAKREEYSIYFSYDNNSLAYHKYGDDNNSDKHGFKTIDEIVKTIYKKDTNCYINIVPSDELIEYMTK